MQPLAEVQHQNAEHECATHEILPQLRRKDGRRCKTMTDPQKAMDLFLQFLEEATGHNWQVEKESKNEEDHLIANGVTVREPTRKAEDCRNYKNTSYGGVCLGTKELDACKGDKCERWKPKEDTK
jgi:hypothetical protein